MSRFREHVWFNLRDLPLFLWRDSSVQHFDTLSGDYVWPTRTNSCVPFQDVALDNRNHLQTWNPALNVRHLPRSVCCALDTIRTWALPQELCSSE